MDMVADWFESGFLNW